MDRFNIDNSEVKFVVESNGEDIHLLYLLLRDCTSISESFGIGKFASEDKRSNLVSLTYKQIGNDWYCFYEPTAQEVNWVEVENLVKELFPSAEKIRSSQIPYAFI